MDFVHHTDFPLPPNEVAALLADPECARRRLVQAGFSDLGEVTCVGEAVLTRLEVPARAIDPRLASLTSSPVTLTLEETPARLVGEMAPPPLTFTGEVTLTATPTGTRRTISGTLTARVPLIGAALERGALNRVSALLAADTACAGTRDADSRPKLGGRL